MAWEKIDNYEVKEVKIRDALETEQKNAEKLLKELKPVISNNELKPTYFLQSLTNYQTTTCFLNNNIPYSISLMNHPSEKNRQGILLQNQYNCSNLYGDDKEFKWDNSRNRLFKTISDDQVCDIADFRIEIKECVIEIFADNNKEETVNLIITYRDQKFPLRVLIAKFAELDKEIKRKYPQCIVFNAKLFLNYAAEMFGAKSQIKPSLYYNFSGWYKEDGRLIYLNSSMQNVKSNVVMEFNALKANAFLQHFMQTSSEKNKLIIVLLYSLWSYFSIFYEEAKIDGCRSVLYLSAPTGTGKTSLAKILSSALLTEDAKSVMRFDDTIASLEESLFNARDLLSLVDDFYAKGNKLEEQDFKAKASAITRIVGDSMIKGKMGANRKPLPDRRYRGGVIATGEYIDLNTHSSYLRCWVLNFPENSIYFNDDLSILQKQSDLARSFYSLWIKWLEENQSVIRQHIQECHQRNFDFVKGKYEMGYPRLITNIATFFTISDFFGEFLNYYNLFTNFYSIKDAILAESDLQLSLLNTMSPPEIVIKALNEALDNAYLKIADSEESFKVEDYDGYQAEACIVIITSRLENLIEKYVSKNNYGIKFNNALKDTLVSKQILIKEGNSCNIKYSKSRAIEPKRPRVYKFNKGVL